MSVKQLNFLLLLGVATLSDRSFGGLELFYIDGYEEVEGMGMATDGCADIDECNRAKLLVVFLNVTVQLHA